MNAILPDDVAVKRAFYVRDDFSARFDINGKRYVYRIYSAHNPSPLHARYSYFCPNELDMEAMKTAASFFAGEHDFEAFCAVGGSQKTYVRRLTSVEVRKSNGCDEMIEIEVKGEAFLYNMVRIIAGTILEAGMGRIPADSVGEIIESRERKRAGRTLPACGLTLEEVLFDEADARLR
jgi:tRNA pseudouridine38-40 synthase